MKLIVPYTLVITLGIILTAGCVTMVEKNPVNVSSDTRDPGVKVTPGSIKQVNGSMIVTVAGFSYPTNLSVLVDNQTIGSVNPTTPLYLTVSEGNHTIAVCADFICEQENVTIRFGKYLTLDFSERLHRDVVILQPTARVVGCYRNGNVLSVDIEFINPSKQDHQMSAAVSCGYSYIDERTNIKMVDSSRGTVMTDVRAGQRVTESLSLTLVTSSRLSNSYPVIEELKVK
jgi:hypothetical protein